MENRKERKTRVTQQRQDVILAAALKVISQRGFSGATIPEIAFEADIAVGTIYNYYENKRELLVAIVKKYITGSLEGIMNELSSSDDTTYVTGLVENRLKMGLDNVDTFLPLLSEIQRDAELRQAFSERVLQPVMETIERYIAARSEEGVFRKADPSVAARAIAGMVIGFMFIHRIESGKSPARDTDQKKLAAELAAIILNGLHGK